MHHIFSNDQESFKSELEEFVECLLDQNRREIREYQSTIRETLKHCIMSVLDIIHYYEIVDNDVEDLETPNDLLENLKETHFCITYFFNDGIKEVVFDTEYFKKMKNDLVKKCMGVRFQEFARFLSHACLLYKSHRRTYENVIGDVDNNAIQVHPIYKWSSYMTYFMKFSFHDFLPIPKDVMMEEKSFRTKPARFTSDTSSSIAVLKIIELPHSADYFDDDNCTSCFVYNLEMLKGWSHGLTELVEL
eukprot:Pgem_evm1s7631